MWENIPHTNAADKALEIAFYAMHKILTISKERNDEPKKWKHLSCQNDTI